jgi:hypothetical protein
MMKRIERERESGRIREREETHLCVNAVNAHATTKIRRKESVFTFSCSKPYTHIV